MLLAACGRDDRGAFVDSRPPPGLAERFYPPENWAWGLIAADGGPAQRYGVAAPRVSSRGHVLILPAYGETAETWLETARDLNDAGYTVWVLEGIGQGGSERLTGRRDLGDLKSFDGDVAAVHGLVGQVIRPSRVAPLVLMGQGVGALIAERAAETGVRPAGLIVSAPVCSAPPDAVALRLIGFGRLRAPGSSPWRRDDPAPGRGTHDPWRADAAYAWQLANPDLRMGGPSLDWLNALDDLQRKTRVGLPSLSMPVLVLKPDRAGDCVDVPGAEQLRVAGAAPALELEDDARRGLWIGAIEHFLARAVRPAGPVGSDHGA